MSSVVISGDISGSVTLDAPSVAGTTVLTLPATSGTVVTTATSSGISGSAITTGTVGVSVGGTGQTTAGAAFNALSPITTTGDLIIGNGTNSATRLAIGSNNTVLTSNGSTATWAAAGGGQLQTQLFTSPGTWTKPASATQVRVAVVGGGGGGNAPGGSGGSPGGTSSFGAAVSCTGGTGAFTGPGGSGSASITSGNSIKAGNMQDNFVFSLGGLTSGSSSPGGTGGSVTYSTSSTAMAGRGGTSAFTGGGGGYAWVANVPVSGPVAVTVGAGGNGWPGTGNSASVSGAVVVEFVG